MQLSRRLLLIVTILSFSTTVLAKYKHLLHKTYAERYIQIDSMFYYNKPLRDNRVLFHNEINSLENEAKAAGDIELQCEARLLRLADYSTEKHWDSIKVETYAKSLLDFAKKNRLTQIEVRGRQYLGRYYMEKKGKYIEAIDQFLQSYYLLGELSPGLFPSKKECLFNIAHAYYAFGDFAGAKKYLREAESIQMPAGLTLLENPNKTQTYISLKNTLGLLYRSDKEYDTAIHYFESVRELSKSIGDTVWMGIAAGNIGICYYLQNEYDKAVPLLKTDIKSSFEGEQIDNGLNSLIKLTDIYLQKNDLDTARLLLDSARRQLDIAYEPSEHMQHLAVLMGRYYSVTGNMGLAYRYMDTALMARQIINDKKNALQLANQQHLLSLQAHRTELEKVENIKSVQLLKRNGIIVILFLLTVFSIIFINRQASLYRHKTQLAESEKKTAAQELQNAGKQLYDFTQRMSEKNELIEKFTGEIQKYQSLLSDTHDADTERTISELQQATLLTDEQWDEFKINFEKVHPGFLNRLREKLPDLTPGETRFLVLFKLKFRNKEMAGMLGIGLSGMRNYKHRLRKKLNIDDDAAFEQLISNI